MSAPRPRPPVHCRRVGGGGSAHQGRALLGGPRETNLEGGVTAPSPLCTGGPVRRAARGKRYPWGRRRTFSAPCVSSASSCAPRPLGWSGKSASRPLRPATWASPFRGCAGRPELTGERDGNRRHGRGADVIGGGCGGPFPCESHLVTVKYLRSR